MTCCFKNHSSGLKCLSSQLPHFHFIDSAMFWSHPGRSSPKRMWSVLAPPIFDYSMYLLSLKIINNFNTRASLRSTLWLLWKLVSEFYCRDWVKWSCLIRIDMRKRSNKEVGKLGKSDLDRLGIFKEMGYISIGDEYRSQSGESAFLINKVKSQKRVLYLIIEFSVFWWLTFRHWDMMTNVS